MAKTLTASKTRSNRPGWSLTFRHPLRLDTQNRPGRKMRRGLGTDDAEEADRLVDQMNELLRDPSWWNASRRKEAETRFAAPVVAAFFDDLQAGTEDPELLRDAFIRLPDSSEGFSRVLFVGTTGAGKTTLLRQLIGSDPETDRFPSTAPAKTTIADIEVVATGEDYRAVVTFFTEFQVQTLIEECVLDAAIAMYRGAPLARAADRFLNHRDQKFRLSYILGAWGSGGAADEDFSFDDEEEDLEVQQFDDEDVLPQAEVAANRAMVEGLVGRIEGLVQAVSARISEDLGVADGDVTKQDHDAYLELLGEAFEAELHALETFHELIQDVMELVQSRFELIQLGNLTNGRSGWPESWTFETDDRDEFIRNIRWFSSNYWPHFGRLLTPVVNGIRVRGPLYSDIRPNASRLVLIDGQGLGHTPDDATSVSSSITRKFEVVDVVLLVDNAQQPMQAAPLSVLKALAISGNEDKLAIAFTHFDQIKGHNLAGMSERRAHVMASVVSALSSLRDAVGARIIQTLESGIDDRCFMLGNTQKRLSSLPRKANAYMVGQLEGLVDFCQRAAEPKAEATAALLYSPIGISFAIQDGATRYNKIWQARLGLGVYANVRREHWTRVKALNKRIAGEMGTEYDTLRPIADLHTAMLEAISRYLDRPLAEREVDEEQRATTRARRIIAAGLQRLCRKRLVEAELSEWRTAYDERGSGSTRRRAMRIAAINERGAPIPSAVMSPESARYLEQVNELISQAIHAVGGQFVDEQSRSGRANT